MRHAATTSGHGHTLAHADGERMQSGTTTQRVPSTACSAAARRAPTKRAPLVPVDERGVQLYSQLLVTRRLPGRAQRAATMHYLANHELCSSVHGSSTTKRVGKAQPGVERVSPFFGLTGLPVLCMRNTHARVAVKGLERIQVRKHTAQPASTAGAHPASPQPAATSPTAGAAAIALRLLSGGWRSIAPDLVGCVHCG